MYPSRRRTLPDTRLLAVGDSFFILLFVGAGVIHHGTTDPFEIATTSVPFLIGWFVVAPLAGAYSSPPSRRVEAFFIIGTWTVGALIGLGIRSTGLFQGGASPSFGFVMVVGGAVVVFLWRFFLLRVVVGIGESLTK